MQFMTFKILPPTKMHEITGLPGLYSLSASAAMKARPMILIPELVFLFILAAHANFCLISTGNNVSQILSA